MNSKKVSFVEIILKKSLISSNKYQIRTAVSLGLSKKLGNSVKKEINPCILGMINKIQHLVTVKYLN